MHKHFSFLQWEGSTFNFSQKSWVFSSNKNMGLTTKASFKVHLKGCMVGRAGVGWRVGQPSMQSMFSWEGVYGPKNAHQTETWGCRNNLAKTDWPETADMCSTIVQEASQLTGALGKKPSTPPSNPAPSSHLLPWVSVYVTFWSGYQKLDYSPPQPAWPQLNITSAKTLFPNEVTFWVPRRVWTGGVTQFSGKLPLCSAQTPGCNSWGKCPTVTIVLGYSFLVCSKSRDTGHVCISTSSWV